MNQLQSLIDDPKNLESASHWTFSLCDTQRIMIQHFGFPFGKLKIVPIPPSLPGKNEILAGRKLIF